MQQLTKYVPWIVPVLLALGLHICFMADVAALPLEITVIDALVSTGTMALVVWLIFLAIKTYPTQAAVMLYASILAIFFSGVATLANWQILDWWKGSKDAVYGSLLSRTLPLRFIISALVYGWIATFAAQAKRNKELETKFQQSTDATIMLRDAELFKLRQQLQPHFLYNSLNSINALIMIQPDKAQEMIGKLSDFLRSSVRREAQDQIPIAEELVYIQSYLDIEAVRFGDRLKVNFDKHYTDDARIPPFLLQPILENAIKFGIYGKTGAVTISMSIELREEVLYIKVTNPYDAENTPPKGTGFGLDGIMRRLFLLYGRTDLLETEKDTTTFTTTLKIPQAYVQGNTGR